MILLIKPFMMIQQEYIIMQRLNKNIMAREVWENVQLLNRIQLHKLMLFLSFYLIKIVMLMIIMILALLILMKLLTISLIVLIWFTSTLLIQDILVYMILFNATV